MSFGFNFHDKIKELSNKSTAVNLNNVKRSEIGELQNELNSLKEDKRIEALQKVKF